MSLDKAELLDLLYRIEEFCDQRADMRDSDRGPQPNEAMVLLGDVQELIADLEDASGDDRPVTTGGTGGASSVARDDRSSAETFGGGGGVAMAQGAVSMEGASAPSPAAPSAPDAVSLPARMPAAGSDLSSGGAPACDCNPVPVKGGTFLLHDSDCARVSSRMERVSSGAALKPVGMHGTPEAELSTACVRRDSPRPALAGWGATAAGASPPHLRECETGLAGLALSAEEVPAGVAPSRPVGAFGAPVSLLVLAPSDLRPGDVIVYGSGQTFGVGRVIPWGADGSYIVFPSHAGGGWVAHGHERLSVRRVAT